MPRPPHQAHTTAALPGSVYSSFADRLAAHEGPIYPLHVGDTWMDAMPGARIEDQLSAELPGLNRYTRPQGLPALVEDLVQKLRARNGLEVDPRQVLVTAGATGGLACVMGALVNPGEEVLILAPFWPLIRGHVMAFGGVPVEVPFYDRVDSAEAAVEAIAERITERTVALYVSTPNNPTGRIIPGPWLQAIAELARRHDLWVVSDETYEDYVYEGQHASIGAFAPERTVTAFSFSKAYGMAGYRCGYLAGPEAVIGPASKLGVYTYYSAPTPSQHACRAALRDGQPWIDRARASYLAAGNSAADALNVARPQGSTFLFLDLAGRVDERGVFGFLEDIVGDGILMAPGASFGADYAQWVRLCFTAAPPDRVAEAVALVARRFA